MFTGPMVLIEILQKSWNRIKDTRGNKVFVLRTIYTHLQPKTFYKIRGEMSEKSEKKLDFKQRIAFHKIIT